VITIALLAMVVGTLVAYGLTRDGGSAGRGVAARSSGLTSDDTTPSPAPSPAPSPSDDPAEERSAPQRDLAVYFGDSYFVSDFNYTNKSNTMARLSGKRLGYAKIRVRGGGGTGFVQANPDYNLPPYLQQIRAGALKARDPDLIVIEGGSNDVTQPKWKIRRNAALVLRLAESKHPQAMVVLVGPLDVDGDYSETTPVHRALKRVASEEGVPYIDIRRWLEGHYDDMVGPDTVHPTAGGHRYLGRKLADALGALGA
jgi:lysophospholipase L1-like esterase